MVIFHNWVQWTIFWSIAGWVMSSAPINVLELHCTSTCLFIYPQIWKFLCLSFPNWLVTVIMFLISWAFTVVSLALASLIYYYVGIKGKAGDWGDGFKSAYFQLALRSLRSLGGVFLSFLLGHLLCFYICENANVDLCKTFLYLLQSHWNRKNGLG